MKVTNVQPSDEEFQYRVLNVNTNDELAIVTVYQKSNSSVQVEKGEAASWKIQQLTQGQLIKLQSRMIVLPSNTPFAYSQGKLTLIKIQ